MTTVPFFWVDAFTDRVFGGNPAAVCLLSAWPTDDRVLQAMARQHGLSETAFVVPTPEATQDFHLRWFTPAVEVDLCGHATLATAHVLLTEATQFGLRAAPAALTFQTRSGPLTVQRDAAGRLALDFPGRPPTMLPPAEISPALRRALGEPSIDAAGVSRDRLLVVATAAQVRDLQPDFGALALASPQAIILTAPGDDGCDFVSRFFAPNFGIDEDPVTGSAHCTLIPYWASRLGRNVLRARQVSPRGGELWCEARGERVIIAGRGATYLRGTVMLP